MIITSRDFIEGRKWFKAFPGGCEIALRRFGTEVRVDVWARNTTCVRCNWNSLRNPLPVPDPDECFYVIQRFLRAANANYEEGA